MSGTRRQGAWTWTQHLLAGGSTPWASWVAAGPHPGEPPTDWQPSGAAQLELVRRLNGHAGPVRAVADLVLARSGPGRGLAQQPLLWPGEPVAYGAPAVDPVDVPVGELVRVGVGALTELLLTRAPASRIGPAEPTEARRRRWTRGPAFELAGAPLTTASVRAGLGTPEGGRNPHVVIVAAPFDQLMGQVWSARVQRGAPVRWAGFVERWSGRPDLPPSADLSALAAHWAGRVGREQVHVVVPGDRTDPLTVVRGLLGLRAGGPGRARWLDLAPESVDVLRRVNAVLAVRMPEERLRSVVRDLADLLVTGAGDLTVPQPFERWARDRAAQLADDLAEGGYPVHGELADLAPALRGPRRPDVDRVLDRVVAACLALAARPDHRGEGTA